MQAAVTVFFTHMNENKGIKFFSQRAIAAMIKEFKKLYEGVMPGNLVVITLTHDELIDAEIRQAIEAENRIK